MTIDTNIKPYFDDFDETKKFYRILFKPSFAVQGRELIQMQTQIQDQIAKMGSNIFADGTVILNGQRFFENALTSLKIESRFNNLPIDFNSFEGKTIIGETSETEAFVKKVAPATATDPITFIIKVTSGEGFEQGENIYFEVDDVQTFATIGSTNAINGAMLFSIDSGVFYVDGKFIYNDAQTIILDKYSNTSSRNIGFIVDERIITSDDDESLLDQASGSPNFAAPGADRYYIDLVLTSKGFNDSLDNFIEISRVENGNLVVNRDRTVYSEIEKELARRTYDESGDYVVKNFQLQLKDHISTARGSVNLNAGAVSSVTITDGGRGYKSLPEVEFLGDGTGATGVAVIDTDEESDTFGQVVSITITNGGSGYTSASVRISGDPTQFSIALDPGKAYVRGFELETINQTYISADRARVTEVANNIDTNVSYGNFLYVDDAFNSFDTTTFTEVELHDVARASVSGATSVIGTAKVRFFKWLSGTIGTAGAIYRMSLFDIQMEPGELFKDVESIVTRSGATVLAGVNINELSKVGGEELGDVFLEGSLNTALIFPLNNEYIKTIRSETDDVDTDYTFQRTFDSVSFTAGVASIQTDNGLERFFGGAGAYTQTIKDQHFHVVVTAVGTSAFTLGQVLRFDGARTITGGAIVPAAVQSVSLDANVATNFTARIIATINANTVSEKLKVLSGYTLKVISTPNETIGGIDSLEKSDIYDIQSIWNTGNTDPTAEVSVDSVTGEITWGAVSSQVNVTSDYTLDNGQRDEFYDHGGIVLNQNAPDSTDFLVVVYRNFSHSGNGYLSVDSYPIAYEDIPVYVSPTTGKRYILRDSFDFRPRRTDGLTTITNGRLPDPDFNVNSDYQYYLPRIDIVLATKDKTLINKQGIPNLIPKVPTDESNSMSLYILSIPPYTNNLSEIGVEFIQNKRYTMRDIGRLENRLENVEYYTQLSLLEKQAQDDVITDSSNFEKFKNGFLVDPFVNHGVGDITNSDYRCAVDPTRRELRPFYEIYNVGFSYGELTSVQQTSTTVTLEHTETPFVEQLLSTKSINVNPFNVISYFGTVTLEPPEDIWMDTVQLPPQNVTINNNVSAPDVFSGVPAWGGWNWGLGWNLNNWGWAGYGWGFNNWGWGLGWGGWTAFRPTVAQTSVQRTVRESTQSLGNNVIDTQFLPFIRESYVFGVAEGFKPKARVYPFIDETNVTDITRPLTLIKIQDFNGELFNDRTGEYEAITFRTGGELGTVVATASTALITPPTSADSTIRHLHIFDLEGTPEVGHTVVGQNDNFAEVIEVVTYDLGDALIPDEFGLMTYEVNIPGETYRTGERTFRLIDNVDNDTTTTESSGEAKYFALGQVQTKQETLLTTRTITTRRVVTRRWVDPLAQSFLVDETAYPEGLHVTSVDVFFRTKSQNVPVTCELRRMINGYPESSQTIPFGSITLFPENVNISEDGTAVTNFKFPAPIHLTPDEYCFVLLANSQEYEVFVAEIGKTITGTNEKVTQQPYAGVLFKSQNASTWTAEQLEDMKFRLNRAVFGLEGVAEIVCDDVKPYVFVGDTTNASPIITNVVPQDGSYVGVAIDMIASGSGIPANTFITAVDVNANTITLSNNATATASDITISSYPVFEFGTANFNAATITPDGTNVTWKVKTLNRDSGLMDDTFTSFENSKDFEFTGIKKVLPKALNSNTESIIVEATLTSSKNTVSPLIDLGRSGMVMMKNVINNDATGEDSAFGGNSLARYITKVVTLAPGFDASNIVATMDIYKPSGTDVKVYFKSLPPESSTPIQNQDWVEMIQETSVANSINDTDYREHRFFAPNAFDGFGVPIDDPVSPRFNNFSVKIVMLSTNEAVCPKIRDFRTIVLDS